MALLLPATAGAGATVVAGRDRASILPPAGAEVAAYENAGYRLRVIDSVAEVEVDLAPIDSTAPFAPPRSEPAGTGSDPGAGDHRRQPIAARGGVAGARLGRRQRPLRAGRGRRRRTPARCWRGAAPTARASRGSSVAMLGAVGIEAREVAGYVVGDVAGRRPLRIPPLDRGALPRSRLGFQRSAGEPRIRAGELLAAGFGAPGFGVAGAGAAAARATDGIAAIDTRPGATAAVRVRANDDTRRAAALRDRARLGARRRGRARGRRLPPHARAARRPRHVRRARAGQLPAAGQRRRAGSRHGRTSPSATASSPR